MGNRCFFFLMTEGAVFKTRIHRGNRLQIPKYFRWGYQLKTTEILKATIPVVNGYASHKLSNKTKQRRKNTTPRLIIQLLTPKPTDDQDYIIQVMLNLFANIKKTDN